MLTQSCGKIVAGCAIGFVACAAQAQSQVTLYGIADTGIFYQSKSTGNNGAIVGSLDGGEAPSLYGLEGKEDLGGGLTANFKLEGGFNTTSGQFGNSNGNMFGRNAYVGLSGVFGTVRAGLQFSPFFTAVVLNGDPRGGPNNGSLLPIYADNFGITGLFDSNAIEYLSPQIAGFSGQVEYSPGGNPGSYLTNQRVSAMISYNRGPLAGDIAYYQARSTTNGQVTMEGRTVDIRYTFSTVQVAVAATNFRNTSQNPGTNVYVFDGGAYWHITPTIGLNGAVYYSCDEATRQNQSTMVAMGVDYSLSKRTTLYGQIGYVQNRGTMGTGLNANADGQLAGLPQGATTTVNFGIKHFF